MEKGLRTQELVVNLPTVSEVGFELYNTIHTYHTHIPLT